MYLIVQSTSYFAERGNSAGLNASVNSSFVRLTVCSPLAVATQRISRFPAPPVAERLSLRYSFNFPKQSSKKKLQPRPAPGLEPAFSE